MRLQTFTNETIHASKLHIPQGKHPPKAHSNTFSEAILFEVQFLIFRTDNFFGNNFDRDKFQGSFFNKFGSLNNIETI